MTEPADEARVGPDLGASAWFSPFRIFGLAAFLAAAWAVVEMLGYALVPAFTSATLPTFLGIVIALGAYFLAGARSPPNT